MLATARTIPDGGLPDQGAVVGDGGVGAGAAATGWFSRSTDGDRNGAATALCEATLIGVLESALFPCGVLAFPAAAPNVRAALFALLRACLAFLLASLNILRACLYLSFANRAILRAASASISAVTARAIHLCGSPLLFLLLNEMAFIVRFSAVAIDT